MTVRLLPQREGRRHHLDRRAEALIEEANAGTDDELLSTPVTACWLGVSPEWLEQGRSAATPYGPEFIRISPRRIRYRRGTVKAWLRSRTYASTSQYQPEQKMLKDSGASISQYEMLKDSGLSINQFQPEQKMKDSDEFQPEQKMKDSSADTAPDSASNGASRQE